MSRSALFEGSVAWHPKTGLLYNKNRLILDHQRRNWKRSSSTEDIRDHCTQVHLRNMPQKQKRRVCAAWFSRAFVCQRRHFHPKTYQNDLLMFTRIHPLAQSRIRNRSRILGAQQPALLSWQVNWQNPRNVQNDIPSHKVSGADTTFYFRENVNCHFLLSICFVCFFASWENSKNNSDLQRRWCCFCSQKRESTQRGYILDPGLDAVVLTFSALPNLRCLIISRGLVTALNNDMKNMR